MPSVSQSAQVNSDGDDVSHLGDLRMRMKHDDQAHGDFVLALKRKVTLELTRDLKEAYEKKIEPELQRGTSRSLSNLSKPDRKLVKEALTHHTLYQSWETLSRWAQDRKWSVVLDALENDLPRLQALADHYMESPDRLGSLTLSPELDLPANIANIEIHRQPGGFCYETHSNDIAAGARYNGGATMGPSAARGRSPMVGGRSSGDFVCETIKSRYSDLKPQKILELGCGTGRNTPAYKTQFPNSEVYAVDCAAGLLRWAHAYAEQHRAAVHFVQMDVTNLEYPDGEFDLVVSHILSHETTTRGLPSMIAEAWRVLAPGGVMFHADVSTQVANTTLFEQVLNEWQVRNNGEPFWMGWAEADIPSILGQAGVPDANAFTEYLGPPERGQGWYCYGGRKPD